MNAPKGSRAIEFSTPLQWNLRVKDTLGPAICREAVLFSEAEMICIIIHFWGYWREVVPFSEGPLLKVPLYYVDKNNDKFLGHSMSVCTILYDCIMLLCLYTV